MDDITAHAAAYLESYTERDALLFTITRSRNKNVVAYAALTDPATGAYTGAACEGFWLAIDPPELVAAREAGRVSHREEFNLIEKSMAFGVTCTPSPADDGTYTACLVATPKSAVVLGRDADGRTVAYVTIHDRRVVLRNIYVRTIPGYFYPSVPWVVFTGVDPVTGETLREYMPNI